MAYTGQKLDHCGMSVDFSKVEIVAVSGSGPNLCGHLLLYTPSMGGVYFHVAAINDFPRYMTEGGFHRYPREEGKVIVRRIPLSLPNPHGAIAALEKGFSLQLSLGGNRGWRAISDQPILGGRGIRTSPGLRHPAMTHDGR